MTSCTNQGTYKFEWLGREHAEHCLHMSEEHHAAAHLSVMRIVEPAQQLDDGALARATLSHKRHCPASRHLDRERVQDLHFRPGGIGKPNILHLKSACHVGHFLPRRILVYLTWPVPHCWGQRS